MIVLQGISLQEGQVFDIDRDRGRMEILSLNEEVIVVRFSGHFDSEPVHEPEPLRSDLNQVLIADLSGIEHITHGGATAIWYLCGPGRVIFCGMPEEAKPAFQEMGLSQFALVANSVSEALEKIPDLPPADNGEAFDSRILPIIEQQKGARKEEDADSDWKAC